MSMLKLYYSNESMGELTNSKIREETTQVGKKYFYLLYQLIRNFICDMGYLSLNFHLI